MDPKQEAVKSLEEVLSKLESNCEDARRCLSVVTENFHASKARFDAMVKTGVIDISVIEFHMAAIEMTRHLEKILDMAQQLEMATNEMVRGARSMAPITR